MIHNEILKLLSRRNFVITMLILFAGIIVYSAVLPIEKSSQSAYDELRTDISGLTEVSTGEKLEERVFELTIYDALLWGEPENPAFNDERAAKYIEKYKNSSRNSVEVSERLNLYKREYSCFLDIVDYSAHIREITDGNDTLLSIIGSNFDKENSRAIKAAYEPMKAVVPPYSPSDGCERTLCNYAVDTAALVITLLSALILFGNEKANRECRARGVLYGNVKFAVAKIITIPAVTFIMLFFGTAVAGIVNGIRFGLGDLFRPLCSLAGYYNTTLNTSVLTFSLIMLLLKTIAVSVFGAATALFSLLAEKQFAVLFTSAACVLTAIQYYGISSVSALALVKFASPFALSDPAALFGNYLNINIIGSPINNALIAVISCVVTSVVLSCVIVMIYRKSSAPAELKAVQHKSNKVSDKIWKNEFYRIMISQKGIVIILLFCAGYSLWLFSIERPFDIDDMMYADYIRAGGGAISEKTADFINNEQERFDRVRADMTKLSEAFVQGKLSGSDYNSQYAILSQQLMGDRSFARFVNQYTALKNNPNTELIYDTGYKKIIDANYISIVVSVILVLFLTVPTIVSDKISGFDNLSRSFVFGNKKLLIYRIKYGITLSFISTGFFFLTMIAKYLMLYGSDDIMSGMNNLTFMPVYKIEIPIILMMLILLLIDIFIVISIETTINILTKLK